MRNKRNLYNLCGRETIKLTDGKTEVVHKGKTKETIDYIVALDPREEWRPKTKTLFGEIIRKALQKKTPDEMLDEIGFNPKGRDLIFERLNEFDSDKSKKENEPVKNRA